MENFRVEIGPDTTKDVIHYVYPDGKPLSLDQLDPNVGNFWGPKRKACRHVYEYVNAEICPDCGRYTHEPNFEEINKQNKQWLKDNPEAWRSVGWWSI